mmetsp:Transcript_36644/g.81560  ORF Transcript_36644/g.81560 Transcript_36644/m.81560 type:complete len:81 (-) Transcript_36644:436-678(-)
MQLPGPVVTIISHAAALGLPSSPVCCVSSNISAVSGHRHRALMQQCQLHQSLMFVDVMKKLLRSHVESQAAAWSGDAEER